MKVIGHCRGSDDVEIETAELLGIRYDRENKKLYLFYEALADPVVYDGVDDLDMDNLRWVLGRLR